MDNKSTIQTEIKEISTLVGEISRLNLYDIPAHYFEDLPDSIICSIIADSFSKINPYTISDTYFNDFQGIMADRIQSISERTDFVIPKADTYVVPDKYFDDFAASLMNKIKVAEQPVENEVMAELKYLSPLVHQINKVNPYSVAEEYFDNFEVNPLAQKSNAQNTAKIVSMGNQTKRWMYYAAAASIIAIMFFGGYSYFSGKSVNISSTASIAALKNVNIEQSIAGLSEDDINDYLNNQNAVIEISPAIFDGASDLQFFIDNASDEEIQQYLNDNSEPGEKKS